MPKVPKINVFYLFNNIKIDHAEIRFHRKILYASSYSSIRAKHKRGGLCPDAIEAGAEVQPTQINSSFEYRISNKEFRIMKFSFLTMILPLE